MAARTGTSWSEAEHAELERLYLEMGLEPRQIAKRWGGRRRASAIADMIKKRRLPLRLDEVEVRRRRAVRAEMAEAARLKVRALSGRFVFTEERFALLERLYLVDGVSPGEIAERFGIKASAVRRKITNSGLARRRKALGLPERHGREVDVRVTRLRPGESNPLAFRHTKDPKKAAAAAKRAMELRLTAAQLEAREVKRLEASAKLMLADQRVAA